MILQVSLKMAEIMLKWLFFSLNVPEANTVKYCIVFSDGFNRVRTVRPHRAP